MSDLKDILEGEETPAEAVEATEQPQQPEAVETPPEGPARDANGQFAPKGTEEGAMPAPEEGKTVPIQSYQAEKQKRQDWENRYTTDIEALRREIAELKQPKEPAAPPPTIWEDEQGAFNHYGQQFTQQAVDRATQASRLQASEIAMLQNVEDFASIKQDLVRFVGENPAVNAEVANSPHPWQAAYKAFKNHQTMQELGATDLTEIEAKMREKIMAEMQAQTPPQPKIPTSLADAQSARGNAQNVGETNMSLEDILKL